MKNVTKIVAAVVAAVTAIVAADPQITNYVASHEVLFAIVNGLGAIVALFHNPKANS